MILDTVFILFAFAKKTNPTWDENLLMLVLILYICFCSAYLKSENAALYLILPCNSKEVTEMNLFVEFEANNLGIFFNSAKVDMAKF